VWEVDEGHFHRYEGDWDYYRRRKERARQEKPSGQNGRYGTDVARGGAKPAVVMPERTGPSRWQLERRLESLEAEIAEAEAGLEVVTLQLASPEEVTPQMIQSARTLEGAGSRAGVGAAPAAQPAGPPPTQGEILSQLGVLHAKL